MIRLKLLLVFFSLIITASFSQAQNSERKWTVGAGLYFADFVAPQLDFPRQFRDTYWNHKGIPIQLSLGRYISDRLNVVGVFSMVDLDNPNLPNNTFWQFNAGAQFNLIKNSWFQPYLLANIGYGSIKDEGTMAYNAGIGFNIWPTKYIGVYAQIAYNGLPGADNSDYVVINDDTPFNYKITNNMSYSFGLKFNIGKAKDTDGDGVPDKFDHCPETFGLESLAGCPDKDGDGVIDGKDLCPDTPGLASLNGCPDTDKDGITDAKDECPDQKGLEEFNGCPDTDKDGIADKDDDCPDVAGLEKFNGCPDTDGDGIIDKKDDCPEVAGVAANSGCPVEKEEPKPFIPENVVVNFGYNKTALNSDDKSKLDKVAQLLNKHEELECLISGHTDSKGTDENNMKLSDKRSNMVYDYLIGKGVHSDKISVKNFGESKAVADNSTEDGRAKNRRVEIKFMN